MNKSFQYLLDRLKERSTWIGIIAVISASGIEMSVAKTETILALGTGLAGLISMLTKDNNNDKR